MSNDKAKTTSLLLCSQGKTVRGLEEHRVSRQRSAAPKGRAGVGVGSGRVKAGFIGKRHDWPGGQGFIEG